MSQSVSEVSIVTINWNGKEHLENLLPSLQPLGCAEIVVVDNGSTDGSVDFIQAEFPGVRLIQNSRNLGFAHPCNQAAHEALGKYLAFINNDMRAHPNWVTAALESLQPSVPCVASRILDWEGTRIDYNGSSLQYLGYALQRDIGEVVEEVSSDDRVLFPCGGAFLIDRSTFLDIGGFDPDYFAIYEDVDLGWRIWLSGREVAFSPDSIVYHRGHSTFDQHADEKRRYLMHRNALMTILKNYEEPHFKRILPVAVALGIKRAILLSGAQREGFYLWEETRFGLDHSDRRVAARILDGLNHLVALDDVLSDLPSLLLKREEVQNLRKRSDQEIWHLFRDPFRKIVDDPTYLEQEWEYLHLFDGLPGEGPPEREFLAELEEELEAKVRRLQQQLRGLEWLGGYALQHPPHMQSNLQKFIRTWKHRGFSSAWKGFVEYIHRGL